MSRSSSPNSSNALFVVLGLAAAFAVMAVVAPPSRPAKSKAKPLPQVVKVDPPEKTPKPELGPNEGGAAGADEPYAPKFGYDPHPRDTEFFVRSLPHATFSEAAPGIMQAAPPAAEKVPVMLYRALYEASPGWKVGRQGIGDCFLPGTPVNTPRGFVEIQNIKVGDEVFSHTLARRRVTNTIRKASTSALVTIEVSGHPWPIKCTADHRFLRSFGKAWVAAEDLAVGDGLATYERDLITGPRVESRPITRITKTEPAASPIIVYCLEVEHDHSFFVGDIAAHNCVSWGWAHAVDELSAVDWKLGKNGEWKPVATEPIYGGSRVQARGVSQGGWSDGSYGGAAAKWVRDWGVLYRQPYDKVDLTTYSANRAKQYGNYGCPKELEGVARQHPVKSVTLVTNFDEAAAAISNGYPVPVCSGQGFTSTRDKDGFAL
ncbi:MAG TPA: Hint domain-containing protein, partial [Pirellulales bacterium]|nr:Hint domain-containing protein [Pirellulales bacterium]